MAECIILCGGESKRMKPYLPFSKALAEIRAGLTILEYQIKWLNNSGINHITLAIDQQTYKNLKKDSPPLNEVEYSVEKERLGTGGAIVKAIEQVKTSPFYVMNIDDILISQTYKPVSLLESIYENSNAKGSILLARTRFPYGIVDTSGSRIIGFRQKPLLDHKICCGHYAFTKEGVETYFPEKGNFEDAALQNMARDGVLYCKELEGEWITVNNIKQLEEAKQRLTVK